jgi:hypothetical protein
MPIVVTELGDGATFGTERTDRVYQVTGSDVELDIINAVLAAAPTTVRALKRGAPIIQHIAPNLYEARVTWASDSGGSLSVQPETNTFFLSGDTTGEEVTLTQAISHIGTWGSAGSVSTPYLGAINVNDDGEPEGVAVKTGSLQFVETGYVLASTATTSYFRTLARATGSVNSDTFRGFSAGELLYLGSQFQYRADKLDYEITSRFAVSENRTSIDVGGVITVPSKEGWDYLWVSYIREPDSTGQYIKVVPNLAHVERVHRRVSFASLGLPG